MDNEQMQKLMERTRPELELAVRSILEKDDVIRSFTMAKLSLPNGEDWDLVCIVATEPIARLIESVVMQGLQAMYESHAKAVKPGVVRPGVVTIQ